MSSKSSTRRRALLALTAAAATVLLISACTAVNSATEQPSGEAVAGGEITVVVSQDALPGSVLGSYTNNHPWSLSVFETAIRVDPETQEATPLLATDWAVADDGLSVEINLRDDVTFHSGRAMTADDVKFSYEAAADPAFSAQLASIANQFTSITANDDTSLTIEFANPIPNLNEFLNEVPVIDSETVAGLADGTEVIGTGPYVFADWNPGASYRLEKFDDYRDEDYASLEAINYEVIANSTAAVSAARTGRADIVYSLSTTDTQSFASDANFVIVDAGGTIYPVGFDVSVEPFDDPRVREAVMYAIDRERINDQVFEGTGTLTNLFWGPNTPGYDEELANAYPYDPERAQELLSEAGVDEIDVEVVFMGIPIQSSIYEIFANNMAAVGINTTPVQLDPPTYIQRQLDGDLGTLFLAQHGQVGRGAVTLLNALPTLREGNPSQFWTDEYESLRNDLLLAVGDDAAQEALASLSEYMIDEAFVVTSIQAPQQLLVSSDIEGIETGPFGELFAEKLYLTEG